MSTVVKNGRLYNVDANGVETRIPLSMDEARSMKTERKLPENGEDMLKASEAAKTGESQFN